MCLPRPSFGNLCRVTVACVGPPPRLFPGQSDGPVWPSTTHTPSFSECAEDSKGNCYRCHRPLLQLLPDRLRAEWAEIAESRSAEAMRILDSSRNRLKPYFESDILRRMFGTTENRLDIEKFMRERKIVVVDLAPRNRLGSQLANTIGALILNEIIATARNLPWGVRYPTYVFLDEFQNFVGPDVESALPEVRQAGTQRTKRQTLAGRWGYDNPCYSRSGIGKGIRQVGLAECDL